MSIFCVVQTPFPCIIFAPWNQTVLFLSPPELSTSDKSGSGGPWRNKLWQLVFKYYEMNIVGHLCIWHWSLSLFSQLCFLFFLSLIIYTVLLISHTIMTEMEECILAIANHIDPPAAVHTQTCWLLTENNGRHTKKAHHQLFFWPLHCLCPITAINTIGHSSTFWCALSSSWSHSSFSISRFFILTMPSTIQDVSVPCVYSSCSAMLPIPILGSNFPIPFIL